MCVHVHMRRLWSAAAAACILTTAPFTANVLVKQQCTVGGE